MTQTDVPDISRSDANGAEHPPQALPAHIAAPPLARLSLICDVLGFHRDEDLAWTPVCMDAYLRSALHLAAGSISGDDGRGNSGAGAAPGHAGVARWCWQQCCTHGAAMQAHAAPKRYCCNMPFVHAYPQKFALHPQQG